MVALLPHSLASRFADRFGLAELPLPVKVPEFEVYISWHDRTHRHAAHVWFRQQVVKCLEPDEPAPAAIAMPVSVK
jgi:DNA-binding transcriptional LysR family regulator